MFKKEFWLYALETSIGAAAAAMAGVMSAGAINLLEVDLVGFIMTGLGGGLFSLLTSISTVNVGKEKGVPGVAKRE